MKHVTAWVLVLCCAIFSFAYAAEEAAKLDENMYLGKPVVVENVTVWPVYARKPQVDIGDYMTLKQAQELKVAEVREMGVASGLPANAPAAETTVVAIGAANPPAAQPQPQPITAEPQQTAQVENAQNGQVLQRQLRADNAQVGQLVIENKGLQPILVLAGTIVKGGKQDRQIGQDFVIMPGKAVPVDSFCVEHGRWTAQREGKNTNGKFEAQEQLTAFSVRGSAQFKSNQQEVWDNVSAENAKAGKAPQSGTYLATVEETDGEAKSRRERLNVAVKNYFKELGSQTETPVGMAYAVDGKVKEIRAFAHTKIFNLYSETLFGTVSVEGDLAQREALQQKKEIYNKPADPTQATALVLDASKAPEEIKDTQAGNQNGYNKGQNGNACRIYLKEAKQGDAKAMPVSTSFQSKF